MKRHRFVAASTSFIRFFQVETPSSIRSLSTFVDTPDGGRGDRSLSIGDVRIETAPLGSGRMDLIPSMTIHNERDAYIPPCTLSHLRWMLQKDLCLRQDFLLLGPPSLARDRRHILFLYAALVEREVEYVALSRDTSDADLK